MVPNRLELTVGTHEELDNSAICRRRGGRDVLREPNVFKLELVVHTPPAGLCTAAAAVLLSYRKPELCTIKKTQHSTIQHKFVTTDSEGEREKILLNIYTIYIHIHMYMNILPCSRRVSPFQVSESYSCNVCTRVTCHCVPHPQFPVSCPVNLQKGAALVGSSSSLFVFFVGP